MNIKKFSLKTKIFLIALPFSIISLVYIYSLTNSSSNIQNNQPAPPNSNTPTAEVPQLLYTDPPSGIHYSFWTTTAIEFKFTQPMDQYSIQYSVEPITEIVVSPSQDQKSVYLRPKNGWEYETTYLIKITSLRSAAGSNILSPIFYNFKIVPPEDIISD